MKARIIIDVNISRTLVETMQRSGFQVCQDGSSMQIKIQNSNPVTRRAKVRILTENVDKDCECLINCNK